MTVQSETEQSPHGGLASPLRNPPTVFPVGPVVHSSPLSHSRLPPAMLCVDSRAHRGCKHLAHRARDAPGTPPAFIRHRRRRDTSHGRQSCKVEIANAISSSRRTRRRCGFQQRVSSIRHCRNRNRARTAGASASRTAHGMLCASLRLHPPSSSTGRGGLRRPLCTPLAKSSSALPSHLLSSPLSHSRLPPAMLCGSLGLLPPSSPTGRGGIRPPTVRPTASSAE